VNDDVADAAAHRADAVVQVERLVGAHDLPTKRAGVADRGWQELGSSPLMVRAVAFLRWW
jgi:hypothetical protein